MSEVGRRIALLRWEMQIWAKCSRVVPYWYMCRLVIIAKFCPGETMVAGALNAISAGTPPPPP